jgi:cysteine desulfurase
MSKLQKRKKVIYLDYAATTPVDPQVLKSMQPFWSDNFGNPSSIYSKGREAKAAVESSRKQIALILNCHLDHVYFTAGGTESINTAIIGSVRPWRKLISPHIITSKIEHSAVLNSVRALEQDGGHVTYLGVDEYGFVNVNQVLDAIQSNTVLISIQYANNEVGSIQPISEIAKRLKKINSQRIQNHMPVIALHCDACQAAGALSLDVQNLGVDLLSLNASKIYGPKQIGCLYVRSGTRIQPIIHGGGQEKNLRSGTENVPAIVGFAKALELAQKNLKKENLRLIKLRNDFAKQIQKNIEGVELNGPHYVQGAKTAQRRLPNNINFSFLGVEGEALMLYLDSFGVCVSTGSACDSANSDPSYVIQALGKPPEIAASSIRFTLGKFTIKSDLDYTLKILKKLVDQLRKVNQS